MSVGYEIKYNTCAFCGGNKLLEEKFGETSARKKNSNLLNNHYYKGRKVKDSLLIRVEQEIVRISLDYSLFTKIRLNSL